MRKLRNDENGFVVGFVLGNPVAQAAIAIIVVLGIIAFTAVNPGIAAIGFIMAVFGFGGMITFKPKLGMISISSGIFLILVGYGYIL